MNNNNFLLNNLVAHRGIHSKYLENSLDAIKEAMNNNYIVEFDIHLTKDKKIVVFHDDNLKRVFGIDRYIRDMTLDEIMKYKYIPTLEDVLKLVNGRVPLIIEFKFDNGYGKLEREAVKFLDNYKGEFAIWSFSPLSILWFKIHRPKYIRGYLVNGLFKDNFLIKIFLNKRLVKRIIKPYFLGVNLYGTEDTIVQKLRKKYLVFGYTVSTYNEYKKYLSCVDNFVCDLPLKYKNKETVPLRTVSQKE